MQILFYFGLRDCFFKMVGGFFLGNSKKINGLIQIKVFLFNL
jgi:hypothetical protein